jgi:hypothetical protein
VGAERLLFSRKEVGKPEMVNQRRQYDSKGGGERYVLLKTQLF